MDETSDENPSFGSQMEYFIGLLFLGTVVVWSEGQSSDPRVWKWVNHKTYF